MHECFPPIIVDSNLSWKYVNALKKILPNPEKVIYVNDKENGYDARSDMSDTEIQKLQEKLGAIVITQNGRDFRRGDVISLKSSEKTSKLIEKTIYWLKHNSEYSEFLKSLELRL